MITKEYTLTDAEQMVIRDALIEYRQAHKDLKPNSPIAKRYWASVDALADQFTDDVRRGR